MGRATGAENTPAAQPQHSFLCRGCGAESEPKTETEEAKTAIELLANLYSKVLVLPKNGPGEDIDGNRISDEQWKMIFKRFGSLPFNYYSELKKAPTIRYR